MKSIKRIVCALDLSEASSFVTEYAVTMAKAFGAEIIAVYVAPPLNQYAAFEVQPQAIETFAGSILIGAEKRMDEIVTTMFADVSVEAKVAVGSPPEEIIKIATDSGADLIVMGTHGFKGVKLMVFGSVAEKVAKNGKIPVLVVQPPAQ